MTLFLLSPSSCFLAPGASQEARPLPDSETLYRTVRENLARAQRAVDLYTYKDRRTDLHANPFGRLGTGGTRLFEVYPSANRQLTYRRLIELNGTPLSAEELATQDRQYRARAAEAEQRDGAQGNDARRREAEARARGQRLIDDTVGALEFRMDGRTVYAGTPAIVITFTPKRGARPVTREGRLAQKFAGRVWVDEQAAEVVHVEAKSIDDISFGFGIVARLGEGTTATLTRGPVGDGLWMPTRLTLTGRGRAAFFLRRLAVDHVLEWFDYRRLPGDSPAPFLDPRVHGQPGGRPQ